MTPKDGDLRCPRCTSPMIYNASHEYWQCTACLGEWWEHTNRLREMASETKDKIERERLRRLTYGHIQSVRASVEPKAYGYVLGIKKGGGSKSGRKRKKPPKKPHTQAWEGIRMRDKGIREEGIREEGISICLQ